MYSCKQKNKENEKAQYLCGIQGKVFFEEKISKTKRSEKQAKIEARETRRGERQNAPEHIKIS